MKQARVISTTDMPGCCSAEADEENIDKSNPLYDNLLRRKA
jgi:hypothetical protein